MHDLAFSPDGRKITGWTTDIIHLWDVATGILLQPLTEHTVGVRNLAFSPDGQIIAGASADNTIRLWNVSTGKHLRSLSKRLVAIGFYDSLAFSPDGRSLAVGGTWTVEDTYPIHLWDVGTGILLDTLTGHSGIVTSVAYSLDGETLASGARDGTIRFWDVRTGRHIRTFSEGIYSVWNVAFNTDGHLLAVCKTRGHPRFRLLDVTTGRTIRTLQGMESDFEMSRFALSPGGKTHATLGLQDLKAVSYWDVDTGGIPRTFSGHRDIVLSLVLSPDGQILASGSGSYDQTIRLWDLVTGNHLRTFSGHGGGVNSVVFSPDGRTLASGSSDGTILLWDLKP